MGQDTVRNSSRSIIRLAKSPGQNHPELSKDNSELRPVGYPAKRRMGQIAGTYQYADETLAATCVAISVFQDRRIVIFTDDWDMSAIMKQITDNVLWAASKLECVIEHRASCFRNVEPVFDLRCQELDQYRESEVLKRFAECMNSSTAESSLCIPDPSEVCVVRPSRNIFELFAFPPSFKQFVRDLPKLNSLGI